MVYNIFFLVVVLPFYFFMLLYASMTNPADIARLQQEAAESTLDTTRDCADLAGRWPEQVDATFMLWAHGNLTLDDDAIDDRMTALGEAILQRSEQQPIGHIGIEVVARDYPRDVAEMFRQANEAIARWVPGEEPDLDWVESNVAGLIANIAFAFYWADRRPPTFFPVDAYVPGSIHEVPAHTSVAEAGQARQTTVFRQNAEADSATLRERDSLVLRQVHTYAAALPPDEPTGILVLEGLQHSALPIAARTLGWRVHEVLLSPAMPTPEVKLIRAIRRNARDDERDTLAKTALAAQAAAAALFVYGEGAQRLDQLTASPYEREIRKEYIVNRLGMLCLHYYRGGLSPERRAQLGAALSAIEQLPDADNIEAAQRTLRQRAAGLVRELSAHDYAALRTPIRDQQ